MLLPCLSPGNSQWAHTNNKTQYNTHKTQSLHGEGYCSPADGGKGRAAPLCSSVTLVKPEQIRHHVGAKWVEGNMFL